MGVDTVIAESGVAKATLYKHFPRKDDLVLAYLDQVDQAWFGALRAAARTVGDDPRDQLTGMFDALAPACRRQGYHGCAFINAAAESEAGSDVHARAVEHKAVVRAWITDLAPAVLALAWPEGYRTALAERFGSTAVELAGAGEPRAPEIGTG